MDRLAFILGALFIELKHLGQINPQYSYYERLVNLARNDQWALDRIYNHVLANGSFGGL